MKTTKKTKQNKGSASRKSLVKNLCSMKKELQNYRFNLKQDTKPSARRNLRKSIARTATELSQKEHLQSESK